MCTESARLDHVSSVLSQSSEDEFLDNVLTSGLQVTGTPCSALDMVQLGFDQVITFLGRGVARCGAPLPHDHAFIHRPLQPCPHMVLSHVQKTILADE